MNTDYYSAEEAMRILNKPRSTFFRDVRNGTIPSIMEQGKRRGRLFPKEAINLHARLEKKRNKEATKFTFTQATNADLWVATENARKIYGEDDYIPYSKYLEWREINDQITMVVKENSFYAGHVTILPIDNKMIIDALIADTLREQQIPTINIKKWADRQLLAYIAGVTVAPTGDRERDKKRGAYLLDHTIRWTVALFHQYEIKCFYAIGATKEGQEILDRLGFKQVNSLHNGERKGYMASDIKKVSILAHKRFEQIEEEENNLKAQSL